MLWITPRSDMMVSITPKILWKQKQHQGYRELMETDKRHLRDFNSIS
jgi:hypothetical protein